MSVAPQRKVNISANENVPTEKPARQLAEKAASVTALDRHMTRREEADQPPLETASSDDRLLQENRPTAVDPGEEQVVFEELSGRWRKDAPSSTGNALSRRLRSNHARRELADARKLIAAIAIGLLVALGLTLAAAWGPDIKTRQAETPIVTSPKVPESRIVSNHIQTLGRALAKHFTGLNSQG